MQEAVGWLAVLALIAAVVSTVLSDMVDAALTTGASAVIVPVAFVLFVVLLMGRAFGPTFMAGRRNRRVRRDLRDRGKVIEAPIVRIVDTGVTSGVDPEVEVTVKTGPETKATFRTTVSRVNIPRVGETMYVLYDPENPTVAIRH